MMINEDTQNRLRDEAPEELRALVSRRGLLGGMMAAAIAPALLTKAWGQPGAALPHSLRTQVGVTAGRAAVPVAPVPRFQHASAMLADGRILVAGGHRHSGLMGYVAPLTDAQSYDFGANVWTQAASLKTARAQHVAVTLADGRVLVVGGMGHTPLASAEIYDPTEDTWTTVAPMAQSRYGHAAALGAGGLVIVSGGYNAGPLASLQIYDVAADAWRLVL